MEPRALESSIFTLLLSLLLWLLANPKSSLASPILAPDLNVCNLPSLPPSVTPFNCCAPPWNRPPIDFHFPHPARHLRVRRPAHSLDPNYTKQLNRAYELLKALPPDDPRSFLQQANIHCAYCDATYTQGNSTSKALQVHGTWLFFSFHRWYLYFHERILAKLLKNDSFALPFWNYDHPAGSTLPWPYIRYPHLNDSFREPSHLPPTVTTFTDCSVPDCLLPLQEQLQWNEMVMHHVMVSGAATASLFFGMPYRLGDDEFPGAGTVEMLPHNNVHYWLGAFAQAGHEDMGVFYASARDPVFYAHHANLDRFWELWKTMDGHKEYDDPDYLDSEFVFYNEDAELVRVNVRDSLSTEKLGYTYEKVETPWLTATPSALTKGKAAKRGEIARFCKMGESLDKPCSTLLHRDKLASMEAEEIVVIGGIRVLESGKPARFDVFVNVPDATVATPLNSTEFAGSFLAVPEMSAHQFPKTLRLGIGFIVDELNLKRRNSLVVTIVPRTHTPFGRVSISGFRIEYESVATQTAAS